MIAKIGSNNKRKKKAYKSNLNIDLEKIKECEYKINNIYLKLNEELNEIENTHNILSI